jgi:uncharacterized protein YukE
MVGFAVDESVLEVFAGRLDLLAVGIPTARSYAAKYVDISGENGWILALVEGSVKRAEGSLTGALSAVEATLTGSAAKVRQAALTYWKADEVTDRTVRAVGQKMGAGGTSAAPVPSGTAVTCAAGPPVDALTDPEPTAPMPSVVEEMLAIQDKVSLAWALSFIIDHVCGVNPFEEGAKYFAGDYEALSRAGDAVTKTGAYFAACAQELDASAADLAKAWTGEAADAAQRYFAGVAASLKALQVACEAVGREMQSAATSVYLCAQAFASGLQEIADLAIAMALTALAGAVTAETGAGPVVAAGVEAYLAWRESQLWIKAMEWHGRAVAVGEGLVGVMGSAMANIDKVGAEMVPGPYEGVAVAP